MSAEQNLGPNQEKWLTYRRNLQITYSFLTIGNIPSELDLEILAGCTAKLHETTCFEEGTCANRRFGGCAFKKKKN